MFVITPARPRALILPVVAVLALAALLASALVGVAGGPAQARTLRPAARAAAVDYQGDVFGRSNVERRLHDRRAFRHQWCVQHYAVRQAARMARQQRMFHQDLRPVLRNCGLRKAGENVAYGFTTGSAVVVDGWMKSIEHRRNLLDPDFRLLGAGARRGANGLWYAVQVFGRR